MATAVGAQGARGQAGRLGDHREVAPDMERIYMAVHKFKVAQKVVLIPNRLERHVPAGAYTIQRLLPVEGHELQYRIKNSADGHERVVNEAQLRPAEALVPHK